MTEPVHFQKTNKDARMVGVRELTAARVKISDANSDAVGEKMVTLLKGGPPIELQDICDERVASLCIDVIQNEIEMSDSKITYGNLCGTLSRLLNTGFNVPQDRKNEVYNIVTKTVDTELDLRAAGKHSQRR